MAISRQAATLNGMSLQEIRELFTTLPRPDRGAVRGVYRAELAGPAWVRALAPPILAAAGLGGWWGKAFFGDGAGTNIVSRGGELRRRFPIHLVESPSALDGRPSLMVRYPAGNPPPFPLVVDELRALDEGCLLGLTYINLGLLRGQSFPFLLHLQG